LTTNAPSLGKDALNQIATRWRRWVVLLPIFLVSLFFHLRYVPDNAFIGDTYHFARWVQIISSRGVFNFYDSSLRFGTWDRTYPPLSTLAFQGVLDAYGAVSNPRIAIYDARFLLLLKLVPIASEMALVVAGYVWLLESPLILRTFIPLLIAIHPGLIATSAWWGQFDSPFTLFVVLSLMALNRDRPLVAWACFAVAVLLKQPAVIVGPVLLVVSLRRYGWRSAARGIGLAGAICAIGFAPFVLSSGFSDGLSPYLKSSDAYPFVSNNAYNLWYAWATLKQGSPLHFYDPHFLDSNSAVGPITFKILGLILFGACLIFLLIIIWKQYRERREFVWSTAIYVGFFLLMTQIHERYLYPASVLALLAAAQDSRMWTIAIGLIFTLSYNVLGVAVPARYRGQTFGVEQVALPVAFLNIILFGITQWLTVVMPRPNQIKPTL
jgi:dolichyl-phosphate-mannose-protein mannosyltransferase